MRKMSILAAFVLGILFIGTPAPAQAQTCGRGTNFTVMSPGFSISIGQNGFYNGGGFYIPPVYNNGRGCGRLNNGYYNNGYYNNSYPYNNGYYNNGYYNNSYPYNNGYYNNGYYNNSYPYNNGYYNNGYYNNSYPYYNNGYNNNRRCR